jgi:predicted PurR-regulated permease PerM
MEPVHSSEVPLNPSHQKDRGPLWGLMILTALGIAICAWLAYPFLPAITWAIALAVLALPFHRRIERMISNRNFAAGLSTSIVVLLIAIPTALMIGQLLSETKQAADKVQEQTQNGLWREQALRIPYLGKHLSQLNFDAIEQQVRDVLNSLVGRSLGMASGVATGLLQALAAIFILFFCIRDRHYFLNQCRNLMPLATKATDQVLTRATDAIHATVYGTFLTAVIQGVTGGLLFWAVGLPSPVLWGVIMTILGILPFVGAILVWAPAAVYLATEDRWGAAVLVVTWGSLMAGPLSNYVYAFAAGDRMRMHPVPTLLAYIGGLFVFGVSGMILGPCLLVMTMALIDIWKYQASRLVTQPDNADVKDLPNRILTEKTTIHKALCDSDPDHPMKQVPASEYTGI